MKKIKNLILAGTSCEYDKEVLEEEFNVLESIFNNRDLLLKKQREYREKYTNLSETFMNEFKILNEQHYRMMNALKETKFRVDNNKSKELLVTLEGEVLKSIKNTFQTIINKKEKTLHTYKLLEEVIENYFCTKEELVS